MAYRIFFLLLFISSAEAAHWYVRPSAAGSATGVDWNNAWSLANYNSSNATFTAAGDTVWIAGGSYTAQMLPLANGTAASPIRVQRPRTTDGVPTAAAGWSAAFDSQIVMAAVNLSGIYVSAINKGHNMIFDGRVEAGWKIVKDNGTGGSYPACIQYDNAANTTNCLFLNMDLVGPFDSTTPVLSGINNYHACISLTPRTAGDGIRWMTFSNVWAHGGVNLVNILGGWGTGVPGGKNITFDRCKFYNNMASSASFHANMFEIRDIGDITWRYCEFYTWLVEGIMPYGNALGPLYFYGNVFHDNVGGAARCFEPFNAFQAFFYNNTFVNIGGVGVYSGSGGGSWSAGSSARNNIYWNASMGGMPPPQNHEFSSGSVSGSFSISSGNIPFVSTNNFDYHIISTISAVYPRDKGTNLGAAYNLDRDGSTRGSDGTWDIGAYEFATLAPPVITSATSDTAVNAAPYSYQITVQNGATAYGASNLPSGLSINGTTGLISGTPSVASPPETFVCGLMATNAAGNTHINFTLEVVASQAVLEVTPTSLSFGEIFEDTSTDLTITVTNVAGAATTLSGNVTNVTAPFSVVGNTRYDLAGQTSTNITIRFSPTAGGTYNGTVEFTGGVGSTNSLSGDAIPVFAGTTWALSNALISAPFILTNALCEHTGDNSEGDNVLAGGRIKFGFTTASRGTITVISEVKAENGSANSFYININAEPTAPTMIADIVDFTVGLEDRQVPWRGTGTFDAPQYLTNVFIAPSSGTHSFVIRGREGSGFQIRTLTATFTATEALAPQILSVPFIGGRGFGR